MSEGAPEGQPAGDGTGGTGGETDWKAETEKWKGLARKHESDFTKTQKELQKASTAAAELAALKAAGQSDVEKFTSLASQHEALTTEHTTVSSERDSLRTENARLKAGLATGLTLDDMRFIPSGTEEEMLAAAKVLAERLGAAPGHVPDFDGGGRRTTEGPVKMGDVIRSERERLRGRGR